MSKPIGTNIRKTHAEFLEEVSLLTGDEYVFLEEYSTATCKLMVVHNKCGYKYSVSPNKFLGGRRCPNCFGANKRNTKTFKELVYSLVGNEYVVMGEYKNNSLKIKMKHSVCGYIFSVRCSHFTDAGSRCPRCKESKGERKISSFLNSKSIHYLTQFRFENCKYKKPLPFDFYLPDYNLAIEYDGIVHFEDRFNNIENFILTKKRDKIKDDYCKKNNVNLLRIPYWNLDNVDKILTNALGGGVTC